VQVQNSGNQPLKLTGVAYPIDFQEGRRDATACTASATLNRSAAMQSISVAGSGTMNSRIPQ
jgi:hypothetical protein